MDRPKNILVIDDDEAMNKTIARLLQDEYGIHTATSGEEGIKLTEMLKPKLILLDLNLPRIGGMRVLKKLREAGHNIPVIIITAYGNIESAVQAMKLGAADYIEKPFRPQKLKADIEELFSLWNNSSREPPIRRMIIGESPQMKAVWRLTEKFAPTDVTVLLYGESGTGKELFARAIHEMSKRSKGLFVPIDAFILPESLAESEVFGYEKGAFTGASESKTGRLEWANGGTLLLDEVSNISLHMQMKLLRVIQELKFSPLGARSPKSIDLDVRIVAATNRDLGEMVASGEFREDLFYRLSVLTIQLPPLRERVGDVPLLARHFLKIYGEKYGKAHLSLSRDVIELLERHSWPGNVRELENAIKWAILIAEGTILPCHLPKYLTAPGDAELAHNNYDAKTNLSDELGFKIGKSIDLKRFRDKIAEEVEKELITRVAQRYNLKRYQQAELLNIDPKTLRTKLKKFGLERR